MTFRKSDLLFHHDCIIIQTKVYNVEHKARGLQDDTLAVTQYFDFRQQLISSANRL